jgi:flagellin FlaB
MDSTHRIDATNERSRGQVGIGTLIVFIAMVLVAAIAAGVLINTAGFLQTQASDTGTESTEQVANNINVITTTGNVSGDDTINELQIGVQPASGAGDVNLAQVTMQYVADDQFANIVVGYDGTGEQASGDTDPDNIGLTNSSVGRAEFLIDPITAEDESDVVMTDSADRYEIIIPLDDTLQNTDYPVYDGDGGTVSKSDADQAGLPPGLAEGDTSEIRITTGIGSQTVTFVQVPDTLAGEDAGTKITL